MKKNLFIFFLFLLCISNLYSLPKSIFGIGGGVSLPSGSINDFRNGKTITYNINDSLDLQGNVNSEDIKMGYSLFAMMKFEMSDNFDFYGKIGINNYPYYYSDLLDNKNNRIAKLKVKGMIIPLSAGINCNLLKGPFGIFVLGDLSYNLISSSFEIGENNVSVIIPPSITDTRLGFGIGFGNSIRLGEIKLNVIAKYNNLNYIGKVVDEKLKNNFQLLIGVEF